MESDRLRDGFQNAPRPRQNQPISCDCCRRVRPRQCPAGGTAEPDRASIAGRVSDERHRREQDRQRSHEERVRGHCWRPLLGRQPTSLFPAISRPPPVGDLHCSPRGFWRWAARGQHSHCREHRCQEQPVPAARLARLYSNDRHGVGRQGRFATSEGGDESPRSQPPVGTYWPSMQAPRRAPKANDCKAYTVCAAAKSISDHSHGEFLPHAR